MLEPVGLCEAAPPVISLFAQGTADTGPRTEGVAEYAAASPQRTITVGAVGTCVKRDFLNFFTVAGAQPHVEPVIAHGTHFTSFHFYFRKGEHARASIRGEAVPDKQKGARAGPRSMGVRTVAA